MMRQPSAIRRRFGYEFEFVGTRDNLLLFVQRPLEPREPPRPGEVVPRRRRKVRA